MSMDQAKKLALRLAESGNTDLLEQLGMLPKGPIPCVSRPAVPLEAQKAPDIAKTRKMTRTEAEFELILKQRFPEAEIEWEKFTFKLANDCRYTPDFSVLLNGIYEFWEVKGKFLFKGATKSATHTSLTKPKVAAEKFNFRFHFAQKIDGEWHIKDLRGRIDL